MMTKDFQNWMVAVSDRVFRLTADGYIYSGIEGCKRLARECGAALPDFSTNSKELKNMVQSTYSVICVRGYHLKPPIDAKVWMDNIMIGVNKAMRKR